MKLSRFLVILSAHTADMDSATSAEAHKNLLRAIPSDLPHESVQGCYKLQSEASVMVQIRDFKDLGLLMDIAGRRHQETVMLVDARNQGFLISVETNRITPLGAVYEMSEKAFFGLDKIPDAYTQVSDRIFYTWGGANV